MKVSAAASFGRSRNSRGSRASSISSNIAAISDAFIVTRISRTLLYFFCAISASIVSVNVTVFSAMIPSSFFIPQRKAQIPSAQRTTNARKPCFVPSVPILPVLLPLLLPASIVSPPLAWSFRAGRLPRRFAVPLYSVGVSASFRAKIPAPDLQFLRGDYPCRLAVPLYSAGVPASFRAKILWIRRGGRRKA